tara:strand:+ start:125 stop:931 length:807 start_codon:yes stop_codon:yes gene_type:complete
MNYTNYIKYIKDIIKKNNKLIIGIICLLLLYVIYVIYKRQSVLEREREREREEFNIGAISKRNKALLAGAGLLTAGAAKLYSDDKAAEDEAERSREIQTDDSITERVGKYYNKGKGALQSTGEDIVRTGKLAWLLSETPSVQRDNYLDCYMPYYTGKYALYKLEEGKTPTRNGFLNWGGNKISKAAAKGMMKTTKPLAKMCHRDLCQFPQYKRLAICDAKTFDDIPDYISGKDIDNMIKWNDDKENKGEKFFTDIMEITDDLRRWIKN